MRLRINLLTILSGLLIVLGACQSAGETNQTESYKLLEISLSNIDLASNYSASIKGRQDIKIIPRVEGYLTDIRITEGSKVKQGQELFVIDQVPYIAALQVAKAQVSVCEAGMATARLNYDSRKNLHAKKIISDFDLLTAENNFKTAQAQLEQAQAQETLARNNLSYTVIKSPSNGVVGKLPYRKGDYVSPTIQDGLTVVADNSQMYIYFSMTERQIHDLMQEYNTIDTALTQMPEIELQLINRTIYPHKGRIESISGVVDAQTGAVSIRAVFPNEQGRLLSGGAGSVIMPYRRQGVAVIPQESTFEVQNKVYVYKVINGEAKSAIVEVDKMDDGKRYVVTGGLVPGDVIIAEGAGLVREGTKVTATQEVKR